MDTNISDYLTAATQKYYGVDVSASTEQSLWAEFVSKLETPTQEYLAITSSSSSTEVRAALSDMFQGTIAKMTENGESAPDLLSPDVQQLLDTLTEKLVSLRGQSALAGLSTANESTIFSTLTALCSDLTLNQALTSLLAGAANTIAERAGGLSSLYLKFLSDKVTAAQTSEATSALSPREEEMRRIMFEVFNIALEMINVLQNSSRLQSNTLYYYTNLQQEYLHMMSQTQMYGPTASEYIIANSTDFGKTQLGYSNITVRNIADYLMEQIGTGTGTVYYSSQYDSTFQPVIRFALTRSSNGGYAFALQLYNDSAGGYYTAFSTQKISSDGTDYSATNSIDSTKFYYADTNITGTAQTADIVNKLMYHLTRQWNETSGSMTGSGGYLINYTGSAQITDLTALKYYWGPNANSHWMYNIYFTGPIAKAYETATDDTSTTDVNEATEAQTRASTFRSEANALLQIYLENARSLKELASSTAKQTQSVMTQLTESLQNQSNLLTAITESLRGILSAIFR